MTTSTRQRLNALRAKRLEQLTDRSLAGRDDTKKRKPQPSDIAVRKGRKKKVSFHEE